MSSLGQTLARHLLTGQRRHDDLKARPVAGLTEG
jgi:hypothetical protein